MEWMATHVLEAVFRLSAFRPGQLEAILDVLREGQRPTSLLCTMSTASGKVSPVSLAALASQVTLGFRTLVCRRAAPWLYTDLLRCHIVRCERHIMTDARLWCVLCGALVPDRALDRGSLPVDSSLPSARAVFAFLRRPGSLAIGGHPSGCPGGCVGLHSARDSCRAYCVPGATDLQRAAPRRAHFARPGPPCF